MMLTMRALSVPPCTLFTRGSRTRSSSASPSPLSSPLSSALIARVSASELAAQAGTTPVRIFSGIQPTGTVHLGNYLGALRQWVQLQEASTSWQRVFCIVDLHSLTTPGGRAHLAHHTLELTATLLACGIDPARSVLYNQSRVSAHAELCWVLGCVTPLHMLNTMIQYKEKVRAAQEAHVGLFNYPTLMAADILAFQATHVPVGEDQTQHLQLARDLAERCNRTWSAPDDAPLFTIPVQLHAPVARVMSLRDPRKKMSKSDPLEHSRISLCDSADVIADKIRRAKTDSLLGLSYDPEKRPEVSNLLDIYAALTDRTPESVAAEHAQHDMGQFKRALTEVLVSHLAPIAKQIAALRADEGYLRKVLDEGAERARTLAQPTLDAVRARVGLV